MTQKEMEEYIESYENVERAENLGYIFYFYGDHHMVPFVSIAQSGNKYEEVSKLDREGVFRINIGVSKATFDSLFSSNNVDKIDYSAIDIFMPHPHYAKQFFICILNPSKKNVDQLKNFISEAYSIMKARFGNK